MNDVSNSNPYAYTPSAPPVPKPAYAYTPADVALAILMWVAGPVLGGDPRHGASPAGLRL